MAESVDARDLGSRGATRPSSSLGPRTASPHKRMSTAPMTDTPGMTVTLERKAASQVALQVEATAGEVDAAIEASLKRVASRVRIPGFRPGKAPTAMVERAVGWET